MLSAKQKSCEYRILKSFDMTRNSPCHNPTPYYSYSLALMQANSTAEEVRTMHLFNLNRFNLNLVIAHKVLLFKLIEEMRIS